MNNNIHIAYTNEMASVFVERLQSKNVTTFGFDTETTIERKEDQGLTSIIQIYTGYECYIFQVYRIWRKERCFPPKLAKFMSNPHFIKTGVASENDARRLEEQYQIRCSGIIDIQHIARSMGLSDISMEGLATKYVPQVHKESKSSIYTNWDVDLDGKHIRYAATDAMLSLLIYQNIFHIDKEYKEDISFDDTVEDEHLLQWLCQSNRLPARNMESIINMVSSSYGRWAKIYTKTDKISMTQSCIQRLMHAGKLISSSNQIMLAPTPIPSKEVSRLIAPRDIIISPPVKQPLTSTPAPITVVKPQESRISPVEDEAMKVLANQFGSPRKKEKLVNQLCNSMGSISNLTPDEKKNIANHVVDSLVKHGKLIRIHELYYLP